MTLKLKIPPPLIMLCAAAIIWWLPSVWPMYLVDIIWVKAIGVLLILTGAGIDLWSVFQFRGQNTTINPLSPEKTKSLVIHGLYNYSRNPMYLGMLLILLGWICLLGHVSSLLVLPIFIMTLNYLQIMPEEQQLQQLFGDSYSQYCRSVRRWL